VPFVRFSRDKRGYEHLYLVDIGRDRGRSRVLYWFRTPPGVRVGRNPFDPETQRALERQNPDVQFDWPQIVAAKIPPPVPVENWREKRRIERAIKRARAEESADTEPGTTDEPPEETVEVNEVEGLDEGPSGEGRSIVEDGAPDPGPPEIENLTAATAPPPTGAADASTGPAAPGRRRRGPRGPGRFPGPATANWIRQGLMRIRLTRSSRRHPTAGIIMLL
jgi:hypothetical protein